MESPALLLLRCRSQSVASTGFLALNEEIGALNRELAQRRRVEAALRISEQRLQSILDHSSTVIYLKNLDGRYILANRRFESSTGFRKRIWWEGPTTSCFQRRPLTHSWRTTGR